MKVEALGIQNEWLSFSILIHKKTNQNYLFAFQHVEL